MDEELVANIVSFEEDDVMVAFAFCAHEGQSSDYLMLQYPLQADQQDRRLRWAPAWWDWQPHDPHASSPGCDAGRCCQSIQEPVPFGLSEQDQIT
ncbi:MAG: hypothetical protein EOO64_04065 [Massilia sp.]|nr:MAG: hypothetical protein EOO64_04065 [Massilia sp.]